MTDRHRRKNYFIKKRFQTKFSVYFLVLVISEAILIGALFLYISRGTLTAAYLEEGFRIERTASFFFVGFVMISLIVAAAVGLTALAVLIYLSHRMAGPLYRFEKSLDEIANSGNLCYRIRLRKTDQFEELQNALNGFIRNMDNKVGDIKQDTSHVLKILRHEKLDSNQLKEACERLREKLEFFKTST